MHCILADISIGYKLNILVVLLQYTIFRYTYHTMHVTWKCLLSPRLYKIYKDGPRDNMYQPNNFEKWGDKVITSAHTIFNIGLYASPLICMYVYKRGAYTLEETKSMGKFFGGVFGLLAFSMLLRSIGRATNAKYTGFLQVLSEPAKDNKELLEAIRKYDFDFDFWPVTFSVKNKISSSWQLKHPFQQCANKELPFYKRYAVQVLAFSATHTFGLRLIYPGTLSLIHNLLGTALMQGRIQLVEQYNGQRTKILTADSNTIDTMLVDNRNKGSRGKTLVICCEGNSGFYEIGIMTTPVKAGYSAIGWNHPGFATSSGLPYPSQEQNAIDAVMQYAIEELGFQPSEIVLFGWSIGGYAAAWAAVHYPEVKALVLDATFDDLLPLAQKQMPQSWATLVREVVRSYVDLNIAELVTQYSGPVKLVRRTEDEIICLTPGQLASNRGNNLLLKVIEARHPEVLPDGLPALYKFVGLVDVQRAAIEHTSLDDKTQEPLKLIGKYLRDYNSTHCTPLPEEDFAAIIASLTLTKED